MNTITIKEAIEKGLANLNKEAFFPLIHFARHNLNIDIEKGMRDQLIDLAKKYMHLNKEWYLGKKIFSSLDNTISYIQSSMKNFNPKIAKSFFNYVKDKYAGTIVNKFLADPKNKTAFVEAMTAFAKKRIVDQIFGKLSKEKVTLTKDQASGLRTALEDLVNNIENRDSTLENIHYLKNQLLSLSPATQEIVLEKIMRRNSFNEDLKNSFLQKTGSSILEDIESKINSYGIHLIKNAQAQEVYKYDGLIERVLPAHIRGLYDVDRKVVESIALNGDTSKVEDLFNYEVASGARHNPIYKVGHTGGSNRSATTLANIAMYFASKHGLAHGRPNSTWIMIYESSKGINTTELVDENVDWTEFEFASPELKANRFLGAVKFEVDDANSDKNNIAFKAVDGFVVPRVQQGNYKIQGVEGDIKHFLEIAKHFDKPATNSQQPKVEFKLPRSSKRVSENRTFFQRIFDKLGLSHNPLKYKQERLEQLEFVRNESKDQKQKRLNDEKTMLDFWQHFSEQLVRDQAKPLLPSFYAMVKKLEPKQQPPVIKTLKKMLK
ncbi:MAG: hypothetical protein JSS07_07555 [Proteobacteria bacterium]|nr:hypothetical protein [Pseudomonadota bacterium]